MGLLRNAVHYLAGSLFAQLVNTARLFLLAKIVLPDQYGFYVAAITFQGLAPIACLGSVETLLKEVPFFQGRGDRDRVRQVESAVLGSIVLGAGLLVLAEWLVELLPGSVGVAGEQVTSRLAVLVSIFSLFSAFYTHRCAAREDFTTAALIDAARAIAVFLGVLLFAWWGKGRGAVLGLALAEAAVAIFTLWRSQALHGRVVPGWDQHELVRVVRVGFPITLVWWVYMVHASLGRICAGTLLGTSAVGLYGFAMSTAMVFSMIPNVIGRVTYPRINKVLGASLSKEAVDDALLRPTRMLALAWPFFQILLWFVLPPAYERYFEKYLPALQATQALILASYFGVLVRNGANYLIAANYQAKMLLYVIISMAVNVAVTLALIQAEWDINGIAIGSSLAVAVLAGLIWWKTFTALGFDRPQLATAGGGFALPLLLLVGVLTPAEILSRVTGLGLLLGSLIGCVFAEAMYVACLLMCGPTRRDFKDLATRLVSIASRALT